MSYYFFGWMMLLTALFLILLVLVQRGRGGGLAGAFGGMGGQSAFGTKAGDMFTRITIGVAAFWIVLCVGAIKVLTIPSSSFTNKKPPGAPTADTGTQGEQIPANTPPDDSKKPGATAPDKSGSTLPEAPAIPDTPPATPAAGDSGKPATPPAGDATPAAPTNPPAPAPGEDKTKAP